MGNKLTQSLKHYNVPSRINKYKWTTNEETKQKQQQSIEQNITGCFSGTVANIHIRDSPINDIHDIILEQFVTFKEHSEILFGHLILK